MEQTNVIAMNKVVNNFYSEIVKWRQYASKLWSMVIIFTLVLLHSVTVNCSLFNFTFILTSVFTNLINFQFWFRTMLVLVIYWILFLFYDRLFTVSQKIYPNNLEKLLQIANSFQMVCILSNVVCSVFLTSLMMQFYDSKELSGSYIIGFCAFNVLVYNIKFTFGENYFLNWPIIEQAKYERFKAKVYKTILNTTKFVMVNLFAWQILHFVLSITGLLRINQDQLDSSSYSLYQTLTAAFKIAFILVFSQSISWILYEIYMTDFFHFEIQPRNPMDISLSISMSLNTHPYIQTLGMIDFAHLSIYSKVRRQKLFTLHHPNHQPMNWMRVSFEAMNLIKSFIDIFDFEDMLHGSGAHVNQLNQSKYSSSIFKRINLKAAGDLSRETPSSPTPTPTSPRASRVSKKHTNLGNELTHKLVEKLKNHKLFSQLYNENANYKTQQLFVDSFLVINALKGLSNMAVASLTEDEYGIVQQNLAQIITLLIDLQMALEKYNPASALMSFKTIHRKKTNKIDLMEQKLIFVLNESIYKITQTFGNSVKSLNLNEEVTKRLQRYILIQ